MAGIEDMIELFRGESKLRAPLAKGFAENSGKYYTPQKSFARHIAQGGSMSQGNLIGDLTGKVKSLKIPLSKYKELGGNSLQVILDNDSLGKAKTNLFQTFLARAGSLTPLAMKGLNIIASLPVAAATMILQSTPANADEANMKLEDFAMLANKDKEGIETIDIGEVND
ncbi:hypothetical protein OAP46_00200 [bacterium]|jgi:hypothetical protein|nr:hypothetical protein [bacterium]|tara:strand:+ start:67 stop:573 length:507 start_codon:yes stop_codon:yes gene_type:complete